MLSTHTEQHTLTAKRSTLAFRQQAAANHFEGEATPSQSFQLQLHSNLFCLWVGMSKPPALVEQQQKLPLTSVGPGLISQPVLFVCYAFPVLLSFQNEFCVVSQWKRKKTYTFRVTACVSRRKYLSWLNPGVIKLEISQCSYFRSREACFTAIFSWLFSPSVMPAPLAGGRKTFKGPSLTQRI